MSQPKRIPLFKVFMSAEAIEGATKTLSSGWTGQGPMVEELEEELQRIWATPRRPLTTSTCTHALDLAFHLVGVAPGNTTVSTVQSCTATHSGVVTRNSKLIWADIDPKTGLIDPIDVSRKVRDDTVAIIAVDWGGRLCDYDALRKIGPPVIRDAAHCFLAGSGKTTGDYVGWSFQSIKLVSGPGDGGALLVPQDQYDRSKLLRWYGLDRTKGEGFRCGTQKIEEVGYKYHMNDVTASVILGNIHYAREIVNRHRSNAAWYQVNLPNVPPRFENPPPAPKEDCDWWLYTVLVNDQKGFIKHMEDRGIAVSPVHARNDIHPAFQRASEPAILKGVDKFATSSACIPVGWWLEEEDLERIKKAVEEWISQA
jgi:dTDP-4-amino-4,6-dideoxygalactose transaminase